MPVWLVDLLPTFAELARTNPVPSNDGSSLVPLLSVDPGRFDSGRPLYWENAREQAVRKGPWKAIDRLPTNPWICF